MWSKVLVIGVIVLLIVWVMNVASMEDDANEKWLEDHRNDKNS